MMLQKGKRSPWGDIQYCNEIVPGIESCGTAGHGGIKLSRERNAQVPEYMRSPGGWYEEDCEYAIPLCVFEEEIKKVDPGSYEKGLPLDSLRNWYPDSYEKFTGTKLKPGESYTRDKEVFVRENVNNLVVISALTSKTHKGMVNCYASLGGNRSSTAKKFMVPEEEYQNRGKHGFIIDPKRHEEIA